MEKGKTAPEQIAELLFKVEQLQDRLKLVENKT